MLNLQEGIMGEDNNRGKPEGGKDASGQAAPGAKPAQSEERRSSGDADKAAAPEHPGQTLRTPALEDEVESDD
jgi:hypothetical protein